MVFIIFSTFRNDHAVDTLYSGCESQTLMSSPLIACPGGPCGKEVKEKDRTADKDYSPGLFPQRLTAPDSGEKDMKENSCPRLSLLNGKRP